MSLSLNKWWCGRLGVLSDLAVCNGKLHGAARDSVFCEELGEGRVADSDYRGEFGISSVA